MKKDMLAVGAFVGLCALALYEGGKRQEARGERDEDDEEYEDDDSQALEGGIGDETDEDDVDEDELEMGEDVEMEHTDDPKIAREIALDHLTEDEHYYTHLKDMEDKYKRKSKSKN